MEFVKQIDFEDWCGIGGLDELVLNWELVFFVLVLLEENSISEVSFKCTDSDLSTWTGDEFSLEVGLEGMVASLVEFLFSVVILLVSRNLEGRQVLSFSLEDNLSGEVGSLVQSGILVDCDLVVEGIVRDDLQYNLLSGVDFGLGHNCHGFWSGWHAWVHIHFVVSNHSGGILGSFFELWSLNLHFSCFLAVECQSNFFGS